MGPSIEVETITVIEDVLEEWQRLEYAWMPLPYEWIPSISRPVDEALRDAPATSAVLEWPTNVQDSDADAMFRSLAHGKRIVNGLSGFAPGLIRDISVLLTTPGSPFPVPEAQTALRQIYPLRYLVVRLADPGLPGEWHPAWRRLREATPPLLRYRGRFGTEDLYEIVPLPERGVRLERWVSYDFLWAHPILRIAAQPLSRSDGLQQWVEVWLNGRLVERVPLDAAIRFALRLTTPYLVAAPNVVQLLYRHSRPSAARDARYRIGTTRVSSPGQLRVLSAGQLHGNVGSIELEGTQLAPDRRGYNLVALERGGGCSRRRPSIRFRMPRRRASSPRGSTPSPAARSSRAPSVMRPRGAWTKLRYGLWRPSACGGICAGASGRPTPSSG
jgi:hypothetical protein